MACPTCGCRLYQETGPCAGEDYRKDAERYRWLRAKHDAGDEQAFVYGATGTLDEYIDKEMSGG